MKCEGQFEGNNKKVIGINVSAPENERCDANKVSEEHKPGLGTISFFQKQKKT